MISFLFSNDVLEPLSIFVFSYLFYFSKDYFCDCNVYNYLFPYYIIRCSFWFYIDTFYFYTINIC